MRHHPTTSGTITCTSPCPRKEKTGEAEEIRTPDTQLGSDRPDIDLLLNGVASVHPTPIAHFEMDDVAESELFELGQRPAAPATGLSMHEVRLLLVELTELLGVVRCSVVDVHSTLQVATLELGWSPDVENDDLIVPADELGCARGIDVLDFVRRRRRVRGCARSPRLLRGLLGRLGYRLGMGVGGFCCAAGGKAKGEHGDRGKMYLHAFIVAGAFARRRRSQAPSFGRFCPGRSLREEGAFHARIEDRRRQKESYSLCAHRPRR